MRLKKFLIALAINTVLSVITWGFVFQFSLEINKISDALFSVNSIIFVLVLIRHTGATRATIGISYTAKKMFAPHSIDKELSHYKAYYDAKAREHVKKQWEFILVSVAYLIIAFILSMIYLNHL